jgi:hypothetical protein
LVGLYLIHLLGLLWTSDFDFAAKDLRVKLPLLLLPIIIGTTSALKKKELTLLFYVYLSTIVLLSFISLYKLMQFGDELGFDKRNLSIFISHIRYGLNIAFAAIISFWLAFTKNKKWLIGITLWLVCCLVMFELYTGLFCFLFSVIAVFIWSNKVSNGLKIGGVILALMLGLFSFFYVKSVYQAYKKPEELSYNQNVPVELTLNGNPYSHDFEDIRQTNGVYLFRYFSYPELSKSWDEQSEIKWGEKDLKGQPIEFTLIRYLSSKGLIKDSAGFSELTKKEIKAIENGVANYRYLTLSPIELRLHKTFYELDVYFQSGYANGFSLAMRLEYWKTAWQIIQKNFIQGVGTGDVKTAFDEQYQFDNSRLSEDYRRRTHNQYLTIWLTFGAFGFLYFSLYLFYPLLSYRGKLKFLFIAFWMIAAVSFLTEDTLETQAGVSFFATFYCLFLLGERGSQDQISV